MANVKGDSASTEVPAVEGKHMTNGVGVFASSTQGIAIRSVATKDTAVFATTNTGIGVDARSNTNMGIHASSSQGIAVRAVATKDTAVFATSDKGIGVDARSNTNMGIHASSSQGIAVRAVAEKDTAVFATSDKGIGVDARSNYGIGIYGKGGSYAGYFDGIVMVTGDVQLHNADCAEEFEARDAENTEPGTVMVIDAEDTVCPSTEAYDKCAVGVVSGAGEFKPGLVLGSQSGKKNRLPIALTGRVFCKVDAGKDPIRRGDLLTTSDTPGHAMKASDLARAFGAVIGKALQPLDSGQGLIQILVTLQ
jgi:hypothetical protein